MKKIYFTPTTEIVNIKAGAILTGVSSQQAAEDATTLSRQSSDWEDE